ncbi:MAG: group II intron reverse transcriptase/maturase [Schaedlerella sp.]|uniref:group II intron reverse transcriptase/maturase n=1 Tax=Schaedlerella sp. TaxID=2676057 RepID=UPI0027321D0B|nr:group II intron reverse transcriptase/maturase [uncultured Schaedlerella sp.]
METKLARISQLSSGNPDMVFTSIGHLINHEMLKDCHRKMDGEKAVGIDGVTKEEYGRNLEENLDQLVERLKKKSYRPQPARRVEIPKENGKTRLLSIYCYEDKLVQEALRRILEAVFESHFYDEMMGFRPKRGCHQAIRKLNVMLEMRPTNYVLDADIKSFFNHIDHEWAVRFIELRIKDPNIIRLVRRMLKAGIIENYQYEETEEGSEQGSVCSPVIANIYMHYVLVWWFKERIEPKLKGYGGMVVYADDFVACFQYKEEAEEFYRHLKGRMEHFGMTLEESKTRLIEFGRFAQERCGKKGRKPETLTFLGFTHYCSHGRNGKFWVKRKTSKKKFAKKCKEINNLIRDMRTKPLKAIIKKLNEILVGYYHYYGITDNIQNLSNFRYEMMKSLFKWLNRRSQKKSYNWDGFNDMLKEYPLATPRIYVSVYAR